MSDPDGEAEIRLSGAPIRYRFGAGLADYLICRRCGAYAGAVARIEGSDFATLNLNLFDDPRPELSSSRADYDGEAPQAKVERRRRAWTPTRLIQT